jgi:hypothetical protein
VSGRLDRAGRLFGDDGDLGCVEDWVIVFVNVVEETFCEVLVEEVTAIIVAGGTEGAVSGEVTDCVVFAGGTDRIVSSGVKDENVFSCVKYGAISGEVAN